MLGGYGMRTTQEQIKCGPYTLDYSKKTIVMGILNMTSDSFSDGGKFNQIERAVEHATWLEGASVLEHLELEPQPWPELNHRSTTHPWLDAAGRLLDVRAADHPAIVP